MGIPLQIVFEGGLEPSEALTARIGHEAEKLQRFNGDIAHCRVAVIGRGGRRRHGDLYAVKLQIGLRTGPDIFIDRNPDADHAHEDAYVALRDAFDAARRRLQDRHRKTQGQVKVHHEPPAGRVVTIFRNRGYGFIESADGREIYFNAEAVLNGGFARLKPGHHVRFAETEGEKGPQASTVHA